VFRALYDWLLRQAASRHAPWVLAGHAFFEAICFPVPPDIVLAPMVLTKPERVWRYAMIAMLASVAGGCVSYGIGYFLAPLGVQLISLTGHHVDLGEYRALFHAWGFLLILAKGFIPLPYLIITIAAGVAHFSFWQFILASMLTRGGRFFLTAFLVKRYGPAVQHQVEKNLVLWGAGAMVLVIVVLVALHFIFP
jgi:membrane protein YqaA with SNARE-associated domain